MEVPAKPVATLGAVFRSAWGVTVTNLLPIIVLTLVVNLPINAVLELVPISEDGGLKEWSRYFRMQRALQFWIGTIGVLGVVHLTVASSRGAHLSIGEAFGRAFRSYGSALWAQLLYNVAVLLGLVLLVAPGLAIGVYWCFSVQAIVSHGKPGWQALRHSYLMVKGRWWTFFGRLAALYVLMVLGSLALSIPAELMPKTYVLGIISMIPVDLLVAFFTVCFTRLYLMSGGEVEEPPVDKGLAT